MTVLRSRCSVLSLLPYVVVLKTVCHVLEAAPVARLSFVCHPLPPTCSLFIAQRRNGKNEVASIQARNDRDDCNWIGTAGALAADVRLFDVRPLAETEPAQSLEDAADDAEVWLNPAEPTKSVIFGTDKKSGLFVYDMNGRKLDFLPVGRVNNVDLRSDFATDGGARVLVGASNRTQLGISLFLLDPATLKVTHQDQSFITTDLSDPYGFCMYRSAKTEALFAIVIGKDGEFRQYVLTAAGQGIKAELVRKFAFGSIAEGCVADDRTAFFTWATSCAVSGSSERSRIQATSENSSPRWTAKTSLRTSKV